MRENSLLKTILTFAFYMYMTTYLLDLLSETKQAKYLADSLSEEDLERPTICYSDRMNISHGQWFYKPERILKNNYSSRFFDLAKAKWPENVQKQCEYRNCEYVTYFDVDVHFGVGCGKVLCIFYVKDILGIMEKLFSFLRMRIASHFL